MLHNGRALLLSVLLGIGSPAYPFPQNSPAKPLEKDTPQTTAAGVTFTAPAGWSVSGAPAAIALLAPEGDTHIAILDERASDATTAVIQAWATYKPGFSRPLRTSVDVPDRDGWTAGKQFVYETSPNERAVVVALARRAGDIWSVVILDGAEPTFEKRGAQAGLIVGSLRPGGYQRESFAGRKPLPLTPERIEALRSFVEASMKKFDVPGAGFALIDQGKVVYEGGIGVKELGKSDPVDAHTLFMAASNTKGMTTLLLAKLVDEKKLDWNEHVTKVYPSFRLADAAITQQVEIRHLICACTGLPRQDMEWLFEYKKYKPASTFTLLSGMRPTSKFGEVFQYSNLMASAAGYIGGHLEYPTLELGAAYDKAMQEEIFKPLGMRSTTFSMRRALSGNHASPHGEDVDGNLRVGSNAINYAIGPHRPAGGAWTSPHDFIRYVQLEVNRGKLPDGRVFVSEENLLARRIPQVPLGEKATYGMGMIVDSTYDVEMVHHGGDLAGFHSDFFVLPEQRIGAVLLTNSDAGALMRGAFMRRLLEVVFDGNPEALADVTSRASAHKAERAKERERLVVPADAATVQKLAVRYKSPELGGLVVRKRGSATVFDFGEWQSAMATRKNDDGTMSFFTIDPNKDWFEFVVAERSGKRALVIRDGQHEYAFLEVR